MDTTAFVIAIVAAIGSATAAYFSATRSQKKQPEDRDGVIAETAERVVQIVEAQLRLCLEMRSELEERLTKTEQARAELAALHARQIQAMQRRIRRLERQVRELGHTPVNGDDDG